LRVAVADGRGHDTGRIDTARQIRADRHIGHQLHPNHVLQRLAQTLNQRVAINGLERT
jgi:hypothetical protein